MLGNINFGGLGIKVRTHQWNPVLKLLRLTFEHGVRFDYAARAVCKGGGVGGSMANRRRKKEF